MKSRRSTLVYITLVISLILSAFFCASSVADLLHRPQCLVCLGSGKNKVGIKCAYCKGKGTVVYNEPRRECVVCDGTGMNDNGKKCRYCKGYGTVKASPDDDIDTTSSEPDCQVKMHLLNR